MKIKANFEFEFEYENEKYNENQLRERIHQACRDFFEQNKLYQEVNGVEIRNNSYKIGE